MRKQSEGWECACGKRLRLPLDRIFNGKTVCPECGEPVGIGSGEPTQPDLSDTQTVDLREMAQMAQEGVGVDTSGEWDTGEEA